MRKGLSLAAMALSSLTTLVVPRAALAFVAPELQQELGPNATVKVGIRVVRPTIVAAPAAALEAVPGAVRATAKVDRLSGATRLVQGASLAPERILEGKLTVEALEAEAKAFVAAHAELFGVTSSDIELSRDAALVDDVDQFLKFRVKRDGLVVQDAGIDFRWKRGSLVQVVNQTFAEAVAAEAGEVAQAKLAKAARASVLGESAAPTGVFYRVDQAKGGYRLVKVQRFDVTTAADRFLVEVDTATGAVFEIRPTTFRLDGSATGQVYPRYYRETAETRPYGDLKLSYAGGTVTTGLDGEFAGAPDSAQPKLDGFAGARVKVSLVSGSKVVVPGARIRDRWNVVYSKGSDPVESDKNMAQSMVYYHANAMIQRAKAYIESPWLDRELTANVNLNSTCNAHWDGSTVNFYSAGDSCANTGLISDVVYHEWGHGLDENTGGIDDGGFSEGYGDVMSMLMTHSNILGIGFRTDGRPVRDIEPDKVYPQDAGGEVHSEGLIIAGTFWDLFKLLKEQHGEQVADQLASKYALKVIFTATRYTDVYDALLVIDDDNGDLADKTPNYCAINKAFAQHGLATADEACNLAGLDRIEIDDRASGNGNGILEPGEQAEVWVTARNAAGDALSGLTGRLSLQGPTGVEVPDDSLSWDAIPARSQRRSSDSAGVSVSRTVQCGTKVQATIALESGARRATVSSELMLGRLAGEAESAAATGLPQPIKDNQSTTATVTVDSAQWASDTKVHAATLKFALKHTYVGDLTASLVAPDGTSKEVWQGSGAGDDMAFEKDVTDLVGGLVGKGAWKLVVTDSASQDEGTLESFELTLTPAKFECE